jgi:hypothetical protein
LENWWSSLEEEDRDKILNDEKPLDTLIHTVAKEFYGEVPISGKHYADMFLSQKLCDLSLKNEYKCTMQDLLYKTGDSSNPAYKRYYISSWLGIIPNLVRKIFEDLNIDPNDLSLVGLHAEIEKTLMDACTKTKASKQIKKQSRFLTQPLCNSFRETYDFGCSKNGKILNPNKRIVTANLAKRGNISSMNGNLLDNLEECFLRRGNLLKNLVDATFVKNGVIGTNKFPNKTKKIAKILELFTTILIQAFGIYILRMIQGCIFYRSPF